MNRNADVIPSPPPLFRFFFAWWLTMFVYLFPLEIISMAVVMAVMLTFPEGTPAVFWANYLLFTASVVALLAWGITAYVRRRQGRPIYEIPPFHFIYRIGTEVRRPAAPRTT